MEDIELYQMKVKKIALKLKVNIGEIVQVIRVYNVQMGKPRNPTCNEITQG